MRLIDVDALLKTISELFPKGYFYLPADFLETVEDAPTVDAEIVVRCQNCKHHGSCGYEDIPGWFCAEGERRKE